MEHMLLSGVYIYQLLLATMSGTFLECLYCFLVPFIEHHVLHPNFTVRFCLMEERAVIPPGV